MPPSDSLDYVALPGVKIIALVFRCLLSFLVFASNLFFKLKCFFRMGFLKNKCFGAYGPFAMARYCSVTRGPMRSLRFLDVVCIARGPYWRVAGFW